ncbi:hypothetical protein [Flaviaesturariibacter amylovorans]|uniref:Toxin-antitoxin system YwqK family antitoxin n=1 Tax=Flaviaesturariibacter amylovorans TaxID=1084520 RepID=A0ABP8GBN1_9BACT
MRNSLPVFLIASTFAISCNEKSRTKKEYYPNGKIRRETKYKKGETSTKEVISFYPNGQVEEKRTYINDRLNGVFVSFDANGDSLSRGYFRDDKPIGPIYYYTDGRLMLYNERDFSGDVYYVRKFDTESLKLIKEDGVCISPNIAIVEKGKDKEFEFCFAQPEGYRNEIHAEIDGDSVQIIRMEGNVGRILVSDWIGKSKTLKIVSTLSNGLQIVCQDSLVRII